MLWAMIEKELETALVELQEGIDTANGEVIKSRIAFLDKSLQEHRKELDSQLKHYLRNRSYQKALAFLRNEADIPKGRCGGRTDFS